MKPLLPTVMFCHFLAAFTVLGMPLFMPRLLQDFGLPETSSWIGILFSLPAVLTALCAPLWGRFADTVGRKASLLRALAGLSLAFALAGLAPHFGWFILALILQGIFGGTLAAANSYLAITFEQGALARALNWTQFSARLALVLAPISLGLLIGLIPVQQLYIWLALLPLAGFLLALWLPADSRAVPHRQPTPVADGRLALPGNSLWPAMALQFLFTFAMVVTFPYFLLYAEPFSASPSLTGLGYSLPHLVYLLVHPLASRLSLPWRQSLGVGLLLLLSACLWQAQLQQFSALVAARLLFGLGIWLCYLGLNHVISQLSRRHRAGTWFGILDASGKIAGVIAGLVAAVLCTRYGLHSPFIAAALASALALLLLCFFTLETLSHDHPAQLEQVSK